MAQPLLSDPSRQARQALNVARSLLANLDAEFEHILSRGDEALPVSIGMRAPFLIAELESALIHVRKAKTAGEAMGHLARAEEAEARAAGSYVPGVAA